VIQLSTPVSSYLIVPGRLVGAFGAFYNPESGETKEMFTETIDKNVYDLFFEVYEKIETKDESRLYLVYLFAGRLLLDYVAIVCNSSNPSQ
jgi:hypothetical protein